jgi:hypothetical protein
MRLVLELGEVREGSQTVKVLATVPHGANYCIGITRVASAAAGSPTASSVAEMNIGILETGAAAGMPPWQTHDISATYLERVRDSLAHLVAAAAAFGDAIEADLNPQPLPP